MPINQQDYRRTPTISPGCGLHRESRPPKPLGPLGRSRAEQGWAIQEDGPGPRQISTHQGVDFTLIYCRAKGNFFETVSVYLASHDCRNFVNIAIWSCSVANFKKLLFE